MAVEKKLIWASPVTYGKRSRSLWKKIDKAKNKADMLAVLFELAFALQEVEGRLRELKKFVGKKRKY